MSKMLKLPYSTSLFPLKEFTGLNGWRNRANFNQSREPSGYIEEAINSHTTGTQ